MHEDFRVITTVFGELPRDFTDFSDGWFGSSDQDMKNASVVEEEMAQLLPRPTEGIFTTNYDKNLQTLLQRLKAAGVEVRQR